MNEQENLKFHELIGLHVTITQSSKPTLVGLTGTIVDETKSMFNIKTKNGNKMVPKNYNQWEFHLQDNKTKLSGFTLNRRTEDRLEERN
jgi:ribonuclease P protein subunit POP4